MSERPAVILPVVLFILVLLGLLSAMFGLRVHSDVSATQSQADRLQTRLAAEAGVERVKLLLRSSRFDIDRWFNNPDEFHRVIVWSLGGDPTIWGKNDELDKGTPAFRFSIVADNPNDDEDFIRFGVTDESSKLNLNKATAAQLLTLMSQVVEGDESLDPQALVDAIVDWRDPDRTPAGEAADTEGEYYESLDKPYRVKNGPFDTVEELLLVKGISGSILYGEDFDRNGLLTPNEDDGDDVFPPDNQDGRLNRGLFPYLTVLSRDDNVGNDRRPRVSLVGTPAVVREQLKADFPDNPEIVEFLATAGRAQARGTGGTTIRGVQPGGQSSGSTRGSRPTLRGPSRGGSSRGGAPRGSSGPQGGAAQGVAGGGKQEPRQQRRASPAQAGKEPKPASGPRGAPPISPGSLDPQSLIPNIPQAEVTPEDGAGTVPADSETSKGPNDRQPSGGVEGQPGSVDSGQPGESGNEQVPTQPIRSPASFLLLGEQPGSGGQPVVNPLRLEHLPILMDRTTTLRGDVRQVEGLININTAPREVLKCLDGITDADVEAILAKREGLDPSLKSNPAWLVTEEAVNLETFDKIASQITARGQQFAIESLGYGDHLGTVTRLQVVIDLMGPVPQTIYYRDASYVGGHFPIREEDKERIGVR